MLRLQNSVRSGIVVNIPYDQQMLHASGVCLCSASRSIHPSGGYYQVFSIAPLELFISALVRFEI